MLLFGEMHIKKTIFISKIIALISTCLCLSLFLTTCGGGAGGASIPDNQYTTHNAGGWGGSGSYGNGTNGNGVNVSGGTPIVVTNYVYNGNSYSKDQINELIQAIKDNPSQPEGVFTVQFYVAGDSDPRYARVTKSSGGVEKFEHQYKATLTNTRDTTNFPMTIPFYKDDGINLSTQTTSNMAGWRCSGNNQLYGSFITGMQGDVTLNAEFVNFNATPTTTELTASNDYSDTERTRATITITNGTGSYTLTPSNSYLDVEYTNPSTYTYTVKLASNATFDGFIWFPDDTHSSVTILENDTGEQQIIDFTLKNEYKYRVTLAASDDENGTGYSSQFRTAQSVSCSEAISYIAPERIKTGRSVVALKNTVASPAIVYKPSQTITFNSTDFNSRQIALKGVLDFTYSPDTTYGYKWDTSPTGTNSNPYQVNYYGTDSNRQNQLKIQVSENAGEASNVSIQPETSGLFNITRTGTDFIVKVKSSPDLSESNVPISPVKLTITDSTTDVQKDFYVLIKRDRYFTVTFNMNGATSTQIDPRSVIENGTVSQPVTPNRTNCTFGGWYTDSGLTDAFSFATPITQNITLYAKWKANVTFDKKGGSGTINSQEVICGNTATEPATIPTKSGFVFGGWCTDSECTNAFNFNTPITESITLYAKWLTPTVALSVTSGERTSLVFGESVVLKATPTNFPGTPTYTWTISPSGAGAITTNTTSGDTATIKSMVGKSGTATVSVTATYSSGGNTLTATSTDLNITVKNQVSAAHMSEYLDNFTSNDLSTPLNITVANATNSNLSNITDAIGSSGKYVNLTLAPNDGLTSISFGWSDGSKAAKTTYLVGIVIPEGVTTLNYQAFQPSGATSNLQSVTLPSTLTKICGQAFTSCTSLTTVIINGTNDWDHYNDSGTFIEHVGALNATNIKDGGAHDEFHR